MKIIKNTVFISAILLIPMGIIFRAFDISGGDVLLALGLFIILIFYLTKTIKDLKGDIKKTTILLQILIVLMSVSLFTRYLYHIFGDYPSLIIVPLFIIIALFYLIKEKRKQTKLTIVSLLYILLTIPLFGLEFHNSPRHYIPKQWYNTFDVSNDITVTLPYEFEFSETEQLSIKAFELRKQEQYFEAIQVYKQARKLEPKNLILLFDLSEAFAKNNDLETAISLLDTAILIDNTYYGFYGNRGLLYYKLKENDKAIADYQKAIKLNPNQSITYANLALVYYHEKLFDKSCKNLKKAESLGLNIEDYQELNWINDRYCK